MTIRPTNEKALRAARQAFTLLEVLVVVAIIVMLAGVGGYLLFQRYAEAQINTAKAKAEEIAKAAVAFKIGNQGAVPASVDDLTRGQGVNNDPLLPPDAIIDPWGKKYELFCGPDENGVDSVIVRTTGPKGQVIQARK